MFLRFETRNSFLAAPLTPQTYPWIKFHRGTTTVPLWNGQRRVACGSYARTIPDFDLLTDEQRSLAGTETLVKPHVFWLKPAGKLPWLSTSLAQGSTSIRYIHWWFSCTRYSLIRYGRRSDEVDERRTNFYLTCSRRTMVGFVDFSSGF